jgi:HipA-like protein
MPADVLIVLLEGRPVGRIERAAGGALRFGYDVDIDAATTPLSVSMPPTIGRHGDARIAPWLWGILPDNADVLAHWGRRFGASVADVWRFADALAFNWLVAGTDAHAKNYSLLLSGTRVRLAPLYDVASMLPYETHGISLAMKVGRDYRLRRTDRRSAWERTADELRLNRKRLIERVLGLAGRIPTALERASAADDVTAINSDLPQRLLDLTAARTAHCATILDQPPPDPHS